MDCGERDAERAAQENSEPRQSQSPGAVGKAARAPLEAHQEHDGRPHLHGRRVHPADDVPAGRAAPAALYRGEFVQRSPCRVVGQGHLLAGRLHPPRVSEGPERRLDHHGVHQLVHLHARGHGDQPCAHRRDRVSPLPHGFLGPPRHHACSSSSPCCSPAASSRPTSSCRTSACSTRGGRSSFRRPSVCGRSSSPSPSSERRSRTSSTRRRSSTAPVTCASCSPR